MSIASAVTGLFFSPIYGRGGPADDSARKAQGPLPQQMSAAPAQSPAPDRQGVASAGQALSALLGGLGLSGPEGATRTADADGATQAMRPNLDALNRVLNHYRAQSEALGTVVSLAD